MSEANAGPSFPGFRFAHPGYLLIIVANIRDDKMLTLFGQM
jgi:hypothetical protein